MKGDYEGQSSLHTNTFSFPAFRAIIILIGEKLSSKNLQKDKHERPTSDAYHLQPYSNKTKHQLCIPTH